MNFSSRKINFRPFLLAGLLLSAAAYAQAPKAAQAPKKCFMWKAVNGTNVVYLVGSIHVASKEMYPLPKVMEDAFNRSKVLVVEVDMTNIDQPEMAQTVMKDGMYTGDDTLWQHINDKTAAKVKKFFAANGLPVEVAGKMKPWMVGAMASVLPFQKAGMDPNLGIDMHFMNKAKGHKKIEQVETVEFQLKLLSTVPEKLTDIYLTSALGEVEKEQENATNIEKLWLSGNAKALDEATSGSPKELIPMERAMREDRNPHMADVAEKYLKGGGPCFFVVGAAHLIGDEGVIALLKGRGYNVFQVNAN